MGVIGYDVSGGGGQDSRGPSAQYDVNTIHTYTPASSEQLDSAYIDAEGDASVDTTLDVGVVRLDTGAVIGTVSFTVPAGTTRQTFSTAYPAGITLSAGVEYAHVIGSANQATAFKAFRASLGTGDNQRVAESGYPITGPLTLPGSAETLTRLTYSTTKAIVSGPTITDVNTDESVYPGESFVITGSGFGATQGTGGVDVDGVTQTPTNWTDTSITCTAVRGGNNYGTGKTLTVTTDAATTATITVAQEAEPNTFAVTAASPNTTDDASLWTGLVDTATSNPITIVNGDQAWVKNPNNLTNLAVAADGTITADEEGDFVVQIWLASEGVWGSDQTVTFEVPASDSWPFGKGIKYAANQTWTWGKRHPMTSARVRIFT